MRFSVVCSLIYFVCISLSAFCHAEASPAPRAEIQKTVDAILDTLKDEKLSAPGRRDERRSRLRELINSRFDFEEMAKRSLARHWNDRSGEEKKEFVVLFSELLEASYIGKIESYTNEKITYDKEEIREDGKYGVVNTTIVTKNVNIPIEYKVMNTGNKWMVYDVVVEGVSFISTYRSQYNEVIVRKSYASLIEQMKGKIADLKANPDGKGSAKK